MTTGHVAWFYALGYCKIITMAIIVYELSIIAIVLIIILDNILPTHAIHHFYVVKHGNTLSKYQVGFKFN